MENKKLFKIDLGSFNLVAAVICVAGVIMSILTADSGLLVFGFVAMGILYAVVSYFALTQRREVKRLESELLKAQDDAQAERRLARDTTEKMAAVAMQNHELQESLDILKDELLKSQAQKQDPQPKAERTQVKVKSKKSNKKSLSDIRTEIKTVDGSLVK